MRFGHGQRAAKEISCCSGIKRGTKDRTEGLHVSALILTSFGKCSAKHRSASRLATSVWLIGPLECDGRNVCPITFHFTRGKSNTCRERYETRSFIQITGAHHCPLTGRIFPSDLRTSFQPRWTGRGRWGWWWERWPTGRCISAPNPPVRTDPAPAGAERKPGWLPGSVDC